MSVTKKDLQEMMGQINQQFEQINKQFEQINQRFEQINQRFEQINQRFEQIDKRFEKMDQRFDRLEHRMSVGFTYLENKINDLDRSFSSRLDALEVDIVESFNRNMVGRAEFDELQNRVKSLEDKPFGLVRDKH